MELMIIGAVIALAGFGSIFFGINQNNSLSSQIYSYFSSGSANPGTPYIIIGVIGVIVGLIMIYFGYQKYNQGKTGNAFFNSKTMGTKKCPFCANQIKREAIVCQFCGKELSNDFIPTHKVKLLTNADGLSLRKEPNANTTHFIKIPNGTEVQHINTGDTVYFGEKEPCVRQKRSMCPVLRSTKI